MVCWSQEPLLVLTASEVHIPRPHPLHYELPNRADNHRTPQAESEIWTHQTVFELGLVY